MSFLETLSLVTPKVVLTLNLLTSLTLPFSCDTSPNNVSPGVRVPIVSLNLS